MSFPKIFLEEISKKKYQRHVGKIAEGIPRKTFEIYELPKVLNQLSKEFKRILHKIAK